MFIVLQNGIYCFATRMTNVKTKVMALSAWPRTWLTLIEVRVVRDGARGVGSR